MPNRHGNPTLKEIARLQAWRIQAARAILLGAYDRVAKLIHKANDPTLPPSTFLVVGSNEPYFDKVYRFIRTQEKKQGTWTDRDEMEFIQWVEPGKLV